MEYLSLSLDLYFMTHREYLVLASYLDTMYPILLVSAKPVDMLLFYHLKYFNCCLHLHDCTYNISTDMSFSLRQEFQVGLESLHSVEEGRRIYQPKRCKYYNEDKDNSPNILIKIIKLRLKNFGK